MMQRLKKLYYVYRGDTLITIIQAYSAEGACDWASTLESVPRAELMAQTTAKDAKGGC